jgi:hypothetical protein
MAYEQIVADGHQVELDPISRVAGALALHGTAAGGGHVRDAAAMAGTFRGYEVLLKERDVRDAIFISSRACGVCGGAHAICSALALEMTFEMRPPQFGITIRNGLRWTTWPTIRRICSCVPGPTTPSPSCATRTRTCGRARRRPPPPASRRTATATCPIS